MRSFEYRLYPTKVQASRLDACLEASRLLYNEMLELVKVHYAETGEFLWKYDLNLRFKGRGGESVPQSTVQCLADRLHKALKAMLARNKAGLHGGFPRFKGFLNWHSIHLRQWGTSKNVWLADDRLRVPAKLGKSIKIKLHRPIDGTPKTCYLVKRVGKWFVVIACETEAEVAPLRESNPIGVDVGIKDFLTDSNGNTVSNPKHFRQSERKLRTQQRRSARRVKRSKRRRKANIQVAKTHLKIARQRRDFHFKVAKQYADHHVIIVVEDLNVQGMVKNHSLSKSISDAGWSQFLSILTDKAERAGGQVLKVPPHYTSQKCSECGALVPKSLSVRTHRCPECGYVADRDENAARNILQLGLGKIPLGQSGQALTNGVVQCVA